MHIECNDQKPGWMNRQKKVRNPNRTRDLWPKPRELNPLPLSLTLSLVKTSSSFYLHDRAAARSGTKIGLLSLMLSVSQGASLGDFLLAMPHTEGICMGVLPLFNNGIQNPKTKKISMSV